MILDKNIDIISTQLSLPAFWKPDARYRGLTNTQSSIILFSFLIS